MRLHWFKRHYNGYKHDLVWNMIYTLRIRELPAYRDEQPIYVRIEHRLVIENRDLYLQVQIPEGFYISKQYIGSIDEIDAGGLLLNLIYAYVKSYAERARSLGRVIEYMDPERTYGRVKEILVSVDPPVYAGFIETVVLGEDSSLYSQITLHVSWNYVLEFS